MDFKSFLGNSSFSAIDYVIVGISLAVILFCGAYHAAFTSASPEEFLVGGRVMNPAAVAVSLAVLYISALAIIDNPAEMYYHGIESFWMSIIVVAVVPISTFLFVSMFHNMEMTSIFQYIGRRFDSTVLRRILSFVYILQHLVMTMIILGVVSTAMEKYFEVPTLTSVISIGLFTAVNTSLGGFRASVWTHVLQFICILIFLIMLVVVTGTKAGGIVHSFEVAAKQGRLQLFNFKIDPFKRHNFYNFVFGYGFITLMELVTSQSLVQRYSSLRNRRTAMKVVILSIPLHVMLNLLCLLVGIFMLSGYAGCDPMALSQIIHSHDLVPYFIKETLSGTPGITGFFAACVVCSGIGSCCSLINAITACAYQDFISKYECMSCCKPNEGKWHATCCRFISFTCAIIITAVTSLIVWLAHMDKIDNDKVQLLLSNVSNIITFNSALYGPLAAVFIMALFLPCINKFGAAIGFLGGVACMGYVSGRILFAPNPSSEVMPLPAIMGDCPGAKGLNNTFLRFLPSHPKTLVDTENMSLQFDDPSDIFSISYLLLSLIGAILTILISFPISAVTGGFCFCAARKVPASCLHPMLSSCSCCVDSEERQLQHAISHRYVDRIASVHNVYSSTPTRLDSKPPSYRYSKVPSR